MGLWSIPVIAWLGYVMSVLWIVYYLEMLKLISLVEVLSNVLHTHVYLGIAV